MPQYAIIAHPVWYLAPVLQQLLFDPSNPKGRYMGWWHGVSYRLPVDMIETYNVHNGLRAFVLQNYCCIPGTEYVRHSRAVHELCYTPTHHILRTNFTVLQKYDSCTSSYNCVIVS